MGPRTEASSFERDRCPDETAGFSRDRDARPFGAPAASRGAINGTARLGRDIQRRGAAKWSVTLKSRTYAEPR
jgi:hypothetical protein